MRFRLTSVVAVAFSLAACSDSSGPNQNLSREEALMIASAVTTDAQTSTNSSAAARPSFDVSASAVPISFTHEVETSHPCPQGGTVSVSVNASGTVDAEAGTLVLDVTGAQHHAACAFVHHGITITVTGDPDLDFESHASIVNQQPNAPFTVDVNGAFNWSTSDGRSGRCVINYAEEVDFAARRRTVEGNICGHTVNETFTWTAS